MVTTHIEVKTGSWILSWLCHFYRRDSGPDVAGLMMLQVSSEEKRLEAVLSL